MLIGWTRILLLAVLLLAGGFLVACGDDDDDDGAGVEATAEDAVDGEDGATQVNVTLSEWAVAPSQPSVPAGEVEFVAENMGPDHEHEMVIIRSDAGPLDLPFEDNRVPEDQVDIINEIEPFAVGESESLSVEMEAGRYLLICNITDEDPEIGSHYRKGMVAVFTVE